MKDALDKEGLKPHLMVQPVGYHTPDAGPLGTAGLPESPTGESVCPKQPPPSPILPYPPKPYSTSQSRIFLSFPFTYCIPLVSYRRTPVK